MKPQVADSQSATNARSTGTAFNIMDGKKHREHTGFPLDLVLENACHISNREKPMWVRTPIVSEYTDTKENVRQVARFIRQNLPTAERYDLLAFNNTCAGKYDRLGLTWSLKEKGLMREELMEELAATARNEGLDSVHWSGLTERTR